MFPVSQSLSVQSTLPVTRFYPQIIIIVFILKLKGTQNVVIANQKQEIS